MDIFVKQTGLTKFTASMLPWCVVEAESGDLAAAKLFLENAAFLGHNLIPVALNSSEKAAIAAEAEALTAAEKLPVVDEPVVSAPALTEPAEAPAPAAPAAPSEPVAPQGS
jgi:hypothetical protein